MLYRCRTYVTSSSVTDPLLSLAFSLYSNKGVFALLLGSGMSRSARVPTGWEIVLDLIRKLAAMKQQDANPDPIAWYRSTFGHDVDYSNLLNSVAHSPLERQQLLKGYFEPNEQERQDGAKMPTVGHNAVASLVASGVIRVIVTTNFDRLIERALETRGINPVVISTADAAKGAAPLEHLECVVIKPNGDYLDSRIKNTTAELATYPKAMQGLLQRIFEDYGLVICGWSADWDIAMRGLIEGCPNRRFTTYWAARSDLSATGQKLANARRAEIIRITDADTFFCELDEKVRALESLNARHPLSARAAAETVKRYVVDPGARIRLHDLVVDETRKLCANLNRANFPQDKPQTKEGRYSRCRKYEALSEVLVAMIPQVVFWGDSGFDDLTVKSIEMVGNAWQTGSGYAEWSLIARYPALLLTFAAGLAALSAGRLISLRKFLNETRYDHLGTSAPLVLNFPVGPVSSRTNAQGKEEHFYLGYHLQSFLRPNLRDLIPDDRDYLPVFNRFEYLLGLVISHLTNGRNWWPAWFPHTTAYRFGNSLPSTEMNNEIKKLGGDMPLLKAGFFGSSLERLKEIKAGLDTKLGQSAIDW
jgi:hypothetical protein